MDNKKRNISLISLVLLFVLFLILGYFIGVLTPLRDIINEKLTNKDIEIEYTQNLKDNLIIKSEKAGNKELIYITNNNDRNVYGVTILGMFYDINNNPINTGENYLFFIEKGKTITTIIECKDDKEVDDYKNCVVDVLIDKNTEYIESTFLPLNSSSNETIMFENINENKNSEVPFIEFDIKNNSENRCNTVSCVVVFYKNGNPIYASREQYSAISSGKIKRATVLHIPNEYDEVKIFTEQAYRYSYQ